MEHEVANVIQGTGWAIPTTILVTAGGAIVAVVKKLYSDMRKDRDYQMSQCEKREEKLYAYLEEKNKTDLKVAMTLDNISERLNVLECERGEQMEIKDYNYRRPRHLARNIIEEIDSIAIHHTGAYKSINDYTDWHMDGNK